MKRSWTYFVSLAVFLLSGRAVYAQDYVITLKNNQFSPKELIVPSSQKIKLIVKNLDATPAEFESSDLNREKIVGANSEISVFIGPLDAGSYLIFDDFHRDTTRALITAQ
jgi:hypothetical protein